MFCLHTRTCTPLLVVWSLDQVKEDVEELVSLFRLWVKAGGTQNEWDQLLKEKQREKRHLFRFFAEEYEAEANRERMVGSSQAGLEVF